MKFFCTLFILFIWSSLACAQMDELCGPAYMDLCSESASTNNIYDAVQCFKKNFSQLSTECQPITREFITLYSEYYDACEQDLRQFCHLDIKKVHPSDDEEALQKIFDCTVKHWKEIREDCRDLLSSSTPFFPMIAGAGNQWPAEHSQQPTKKVRIAGTDKTVDAVLQEGDVIWYEGKLIDKKVVERYPFCPEVKDKGLKMIVNNSADYCFYDVIDETRKMVVSELKSLELLVKIDYLGVRDWPSTQDKNVVAVLDKYSQRCPDGFFIDVFHHQDTATVEVLCVSKERQDCDYTKGWTTSYSREGMLGCKRLAQCKDMDSTYEDFQDQKYCAECFAGGCLDLGKGHMYCKVNYKDPQNTEGCLSR